jgi:UDP:flavonoid glycosyltransferase YjiC (YdhE family)
VNVLFVTLPERGHLHPMLGPAAEIARRGHRVAFHAARDISAALGAVGFEQLHAHEVPPPAHDNRGAALAALVRDAPRLRAWIKALLLDDVPAAVARLERVVAAFRPAVIVADPMAYEAPIVAARAGIPWAALSSSLNPVVPDTLQSELLATTAWLAEDRDALFARYGIAGRFRVCDCLSPDLTIAFTTEALVGDAPEGVLLAGPSRSSGPRGDELDFPWNQLEIDRPFLYVSLGSQVFHQPRIFATLTEAARGEPYALVISAGDLAASIAAPNVCAVPYAPQLALLPRAAAMVTHGGANSVMEALSCGVPLLVTPICNDQPHNAHFVEQSGAGIQLDLQVASVAECRAALRSLVDAGPHREAAARVATSYAARDGAAIAAERALALGA